jgi:hypothetical protein
MVTASEISLPQVLSGALKEKLINRVPCQQPDVAESDV